MCEYCGCQSIPVIAELTREHILAEQDGLFPAALATLRAEDWERIDTLRDTVR